ncbi:hypothetical protein CJU75_00855 [Pseudomonas fragi]|nr:hypothetical protein CJU75_00855 [Pseudomonas fragi]
MPSQASPHPQFQGGVCRELAGIRSLERHKTCGSWLACDAGDRVWQVNRGDAIASKPAPTVSGRRLPRAGQHQALRAPQNLWELACLRYRR